jgi:hypothetical protein
MEGPQDGDIMPKRITVVVPRAAARGDTRLARDLGTWSATAVVIGTIIGSSIFRLPGPVAREVGFAVLAAGLLIYWLWRWRMMT